MCKSKMSYWLVFKNRRNSHRTEIRFSTRRAAVRRARWLNDLWTGCKARAIKRTVRDTILV